MRTLRLERFALLSEENKIQKTINYYVISMHISMCVYFIFKQKENRKNMLLALDTCDGVGGSRLFDGKGKKRGKRSSAKKWRRTYNVIT